MTTTNNGNMKKKEEFDIRPGDMIVHLYDHNIVWFIKSEPRHDHRQGWVVDTIWIDSNIPKTVPELFRLHSLKRQKTSHIDAAGRERKHKKRYYKLIRMPRTTT